MKIAQVAPLYESIPPKYYGGTERVVSYLTEELVHQGHHVTLFASGDSVTKAHLIAPCRRSLRLDKHCVDRLVHHVLMIEQVIRTAHEFDVIHFHTDYLHYPFFRRSRFPYVSTFHGRLDLLDLVSLFKDFQEMPVVSISDSQRLPHPNLNWQDTIHHGLPPDLYKFHEKRGQYLAFLGRVCAEKRLDLAIEIAKRTNIPIKIAAKVDTVDEIYFKEMIVPLLNNPLVEFIGEISEGEKNAFLGNAHALLFPIDWPEPFGLVMIEAMACGTPVVAFRKGAVEEVLKDGLTGFIVNNLEEAVKATKKVSGLSRKRCRETFEKRFTVARMARDYLKVYEHLLSGRKTERRKR